MSLEMDKCTEQFTLRIPEILKSDLEKLTRTQKTDLIEEIILTMARAVHSANFNPQLYLKTDSND